MWIAASQTVLCHSPANTRDHLAVAGPISYTRKSMVPPKPVSIVSVPTGEFKMETIRRPR